LNNYKDLTDIEIFENIVKYDSKALEELYIRYSPILFSLIKKIVVDVKVAETILLDVFTTVWEKIDLFNFKTANVYAWMIFLTRNKAIDYLRNSGNSYSKDNKYEDFYIMPLLDSNTDSLSLKSAIRAKSEISEALDNLTDAQKYVLLLSFYEGLTLDQIAEKLNIPIPTVRSKIALALNKLKENLLGE
jgi:RNA polymerase sigma-70 factor (ECF subfamily)